LKIGGSGLDRIEKIFVVTLAEHIKNFSCDPIVQICEGSVGLHVAINGKNSAGASLHLANFSVKYVSVTL